jgi:hypothetical protein
MPVFATSDELKEVAIAFAERVIRDAANAPPLVEIGLCLKWRIKEPELEFAIDLAKKPAAEDQFFTYYIGDPERNPEVIFTMKGDAFHSFWLGKLSLPKALATRAVVIVKGNPVKILKLLPKIKGVYGLYREALRETGHADLIKD